MKKVKLLLTFAICAMISISCSKDDDSSSSSNAPEGVPTGKIVPVSERSIVLTGFDDANEGKGAMAQVEWEYDNGRFYSTGSNCTENFDENIESDLFISFMPNGDLEYRDVDGELLYTRTWEWADSKKGVHLDGETDVTFLFSELNKDRVVYYSSQNYGDCTLISYEVLVK